MKTFLTPTTLGTNQMNFYSSFLLSVTLACTTLSTSANSQTDSIPHAMRAMDEFIEAFNARDIQSWSESLNYPHVRFASGGVKVWHDQKTFIAESNLTPLIRSGWDHSHWLSRDVVLSSPDKVHISTTFQRFDKENQPISTYQSLYIVTLVEGHWGIQARSSLAP